MLACRCFCYTGYKERYVCMYICCTLVCVYIIYIMHLYMYVSLYVCMYATHYRLPYGETSTQWTTPALSLSSGPGGIVMYSYVCVLCTYLLIYLVTYLVASYVFTYLILLLQLHYRELNVQCLNKEDFNLLYVNLRKYIANIA